MCHRIIEWIERIFFDFFPSPFYGGSESLSRVMEKLSDVRKREAKDFLKKGRRRKNDGDDQDSIEI